MNRSIVLVLALVFAGYASATSQTLADGESSACAGKDSTRYVAGGEECLVYKAFGVPTAGESPVLVVYLHGDVESGPADYLYVSAGWYIKPGVITMALLRPGYYDSEGNYSTDGELKNQRDNYTSHNVEAVALAIQTLKKRYGAKKVILIGHSGGAVYAGVILGKYPALAQRAILANCNCNIIAWRSAMRFGNWSSSLSPSDFVNDILPTTRIIAISASGDDVVPTIVPRKYIDTLRERGLNAEYVEIPGDNHKFGPIVTSRAFSRGLSSLRDDAVR